MAFIELNHYQIANLRELIRTIGYWGALQGEPDGAQLPHGHPLGALDTGDWVGEVWWALPEVAVAPNKTWQEQREAVTRQIEAFQP